MNLHVKKHWEVVDHSGKAFRKIKRGGVLLYFLYLLAENVNKHKQGKIVLFKASFCMLCSSAKGAYLIGLLCCLRNNFFFLYYRLGMGNFFFLCLP